MVGMKVLHTTPIIENTTDCCHSKIELNGASRLKTVADDLVPIRTDSVQYSTVNLIQQ